MVAAKFDAAKQFDVSWNPNPLVTGYGCLRHFGCGMTALTW
jgi:hypothetical protein